MEKEKDKLIKNPDESSNAKKERRVNSEVCRYLIIGICTTLVNYLLFLFLCYMTPMGDSNAGINGANVIAISVAIVFAYVTNRVIVFKSEACGKMAIAKEMMRFVLARLGTMAIEVIGVYLMVSLAGQEPFAGKLLIQIIVVAGNYFISRYLVFK